jgi:hypothetical protein
MTTPISPGSEVPPPPQHDAGIQVAPLVSPLHDAAAAPPAEGFFAPAEFPKGFWRSVDYLLQHPYNIPESLRLEKDLWQLCRLFLVISIVMAAIYGTMMGASNLIQGSEMPLGYKLLQILTTSIKVPVLFLFTLVVVLFPIYVSNAFVGERWTFRQTVAALLAACAVSTTVLASMTTVAYFFAFTSRSYDFIKLLHVVFFAYAGAVGIGYLVRCMDVLAQDCQRKARRDVLVIWLALYAFVGMQLAWELRPFVGSPTKPFELFRDHAGNFYESVWYSLQRFLETGFD